MVVVIGSMALVDDVRSQLIPSMISLAVVLGAAFLRQRAAARQPETPRSGAAVRA